MNSQTQIQDYYNSIFTIPIDSHFCSEQMKSKSYLYYLTDSSSNTTISSLSASGEEEDFPSKPKTIQFTSLLKKSYKASIKQQKRKYVNQVKKEVSYDALYL